MKLPMTCMACFMEDGRPREHFVRVELRDDGLYAATCDRGHETVTAIQEPKYEILFDLAAMALLDGYPRESIAGMAAAVERFYEHYVRVIALKHGVDEHVIETVWKHLDNSSERQFGAYLATSMLDRPKEIPATIEREKPSIPGRSKGDTKEWKAFRNAVIHKGYMPSTEECLAYSEIVYQHLRSLVQVLQDSSGEFVEQATFQRLSRAHQAGSGSRVSTMSIPTMLSAGRGDGPKATFKEALQDLPQYRGLYQR